MDVIPDGWEDDYILGRGPSDKVFKARLDRTIKAIVEPGVMSFISEKDFEDMVKAVLAARTVEEKCIPAI